MVMLPENYDPSKENEDDYMNERQLEYFRLKLEEWKTSLLNQSVETMDMLKQEGEASAPDELDRASEAAEKSLELHKRDRERKLIKKIDAALDRIKDGTFGYCEVTGDPIGVRRLMARPIATMTVEAQEAKEKAEEKK